MAPPLYAKQFVCVADAFIPTLISRMHNDVPDDLDFWLLGRVPELHFVAMQDGPHCTCTNCVHGETCPATGPATRTSSQPKHAQTTAGRKRTVEASACPLPVKMEQSVYQYVDTDDEDASSHSLSAMREAWSPPSGNRPSRCPSELSCRGLERTRRSARLSLLFSMRGVPCRRKGLAPRAAFRISIGA